MPRKPKATIDILANLELIMKTATSDEIRAEAREQYVRLKATMQPPAPAPPVVRVEPTKDEQADAFRKMAEELESLKATLPTLKSVVPANRESESQVFKHEAEVAKKIENLAEPVEREKGSIWRLSDGQDYRYLGFENGLHLVTPVRATNSLTPVVERVTEDTLRNVKPKSVQQERRYISDGRIGTLDEIRRRNWQRQQQVAAELRQRGVRQAGFGDPPGC